MDLRRNTSARNFARTFSEVARDANNVVLTAYASVALLVAVIAGWRFGIGWGIAVLLAIFVFLLVLTGVRLQEQLDQPVMAPVGPDRLTILKEQDALSLENVVHASSSPRADLSGLTAADPYFEVSVQLFNGSLFELEPVLVDGHIKMSDTTGGPATEYAKVPELRPRFTLGGNDTGRGRVISMTLRQWLSPEAAADLDRRFPPGTRIAFYLDSIGVTFSVRDGGSRWDGKPMRRDPGRDGLGWLERVRPPARP